jgi:hypothetical protein
MLYYIHNDDPYNERVYRDDDERDEAREEAEQAVEDMRKLAHNIDNSPLSEAEAVSLLDALEAIDYPDVDSDDAEEILDDVARFNEEVAAVGERFNMALYGGAE